MKQRLLKMGLLMITSSSLLFTSCDDDNDGEENDNEIITTVQLTFTPVSGGSSLVYDYDDADGPGGANPTVDNITLAPNTIYNVTVQFINKTLNPDEDITEEVVAEAQAHRIYYLASPGSNITVGNLNNDPNGVPLGVTSTWNTGNAATGTLRVVLRHYPNTPPDKAVDDSVESTKSSTDVDVSFNTAIQ